MSQDRCAIRLSRRRGNGLSLLELIVVLFIISLMIGLLLPAVQSARAKAQGTACQNNVRQLGSALRRYIDTSRRFPEPDKWSICVLKWVEEWDLADSIGGSVAEGTVIGRPPLFRCPAQTDVESNVSTVGVSHYTLVVDRPVNRFKADRVRWDMQDREELVTEASLKPWYFGPEINFAQQIEIISRKSGPHLSGVFYSKSGAVYGAE